MSNTALNSAAVDPRPHVSRIRILSFIQDPEGLQISKRSKDQAIAILKGIRERIVNGESFSELAKKESDCSSAKNGGDLGEFGRGQVRSLTS